MPLAPRLHSTRGGSARTGQKDSMSRTGIEEATNSVATSGSNTPSSAANAGSEMGACPSAARTALAACASALRQLASQSGSAWCSPVLSCDSAEAGSSASESLSTHAGSCHARSGSSATWGASPSPASHVRSGLEVGRSPTRMTRSGRRRAASPGSRSSRS